MVNVNQFKRLACKQWDPQRPTKQQCEDEGKSGPDPVRVAGYVVDGHCRTKPNKGAKTPGKKPTVNKSAKKPPAKKRASPSSRHSSPGSGRELDFGAHDADFDAGSFPSIKGTSKKKKRKRSQKAKGIPGSAMKSKRAELKRAKSKRQTREMAKLAPHPKTPSNRVYNNNNMEEEVDTVVDSILIFGAKEASLVECLERNEEDIVKINEKIEFG